MRGAYTYEIPDHQRTGWNSLCCHAKGIKDRMRDAIVVVYKGSKHKIEKPVRFSATFHLDYWVVMLLAIIAPISILINLIDWIEQFHQQNDFELGPGVNKHPYFMVSAFGIVMPYALLVYRIFRMCPYPGLMMAHAVLQMIIALLIFIGLIFAYKSHTGSNIPTIPHLYSLHSLVGFLAILAYIGQFAFGVICGIAQRGQEGSLHKQLHLHRILGIIVYILGFWAMMTGLTQIPYYLFYWLYHEGIPEAKLINSLGMFVASGAATIIFAVARRKYQLRKGDAEFSLGPIFRVGCAKTFGKLKRFRRKKKSKRQKKARCSCNL